MLMSKGFLSGFDVMVIRLILRAASIILSRFTVLHRVMAALLPPFSRLPRALAGLRRAALAHRAIVIGSAFAIIIVAAFSGPIAVFLELHSPYDRFGIARLYPPDAGGLHWDSRSWLASART